MNKKVKKYFAHCKASSEVYRKEARPGKAATKGTANRARKAGRRAAKRAR